jgi:L-threonylcarbamoyladenylate synthase
MKPTENPENPREQPSGPARQAVVALPDEATLVWAAELLTKGEVVAVPTETVYGLAADATNPEAVAGIYAAKGRPSFNPLIVHVGADMNSLASLEAAGLINANLLTPSARLLADRLIATFWPGPLTIVLPKGPKLPDIVSANLPSVGIRMPAHPAFLALLQRCGRPLAAPSANRSNRISPTCAVHVAADLGERIPLILDGGATTVGVESTIIDVTGAGEPRILRFGGVSLAQLATTGCTPIIPQESGEKPQAPGMQRVHYAPSTPLLLLARDHVDALTAWIKSRSTPPRLGLLLLQGPAEVPLLWNAATSGATFEILCLDDPGDGSKAGQGLYAALHQLDLAKVDLIVAEMPPNTAEGLWPAVRDRLTRASARWCI